jgi:hypothetical protein
MNHLTASAIGESLAIFPPEIGLHKTEPIDAAKFEQALVNAEQEYESVLLVNPADTRGIGVNSAMRSAFENVGAINQKYKSALEESVKTLSKIDPTDPRAMVIALETAVHMSTAEVQMQFAIKSAGASKEALNTLLRSQG